MDIILLAMSLATNANMLYTGGRITGYLPLLKIVSALNETQDELNRRANRLTFERRLLGYMERRMRPRNRILGIASPGLSHLMKGCDSISRLRLR